VWHAGFIFFLYHSGISMSILPIFAVQLFFVGIIQCSVFSLGNGSLAPCVLLHTAANASTAIYYGSYNRVADTGSYVAETVAAFLIATILFRVTAKRNGRQLFHTPQLS